MFFRFLAISVILCLTMTSQAVTLKQFDSPALSRADFNRLAVQAGSSLYWMVDQNQNGLIEPEELAATGKGKTLARYVADGKFTPRFIQEYKALVELKRQASVVQELNGGRPILVTSDFSKATAAEKGLIKSLLDAAWIIEELYLHQTGGFRYWKKSAKLDSASKSVFWRNHGPWCETALSQNEVFCSASPEFPPKRSEAYPLDLDQDEAMCKMLQNQPNANELLNPFTIVQREGNKFVAIPVHKAFNKKMKGVAVRLRAAAGAISKNESEKALYNYLMAAANGFESNDWSEADEAWVSMNSENSKWYLRVAPDEVYFDPCQQKAGFHLDFGVIDQKAQAWQKKLTPLRTEMENAMAKLIGKPYQARNIRFHMPDFFQVVINAGDSRHPLGAVIGESLPNWGKIVQEGRGRTVVMTNLYTDDDSKQVSRKQAAALLSKESQAHFGDDNEMGLLNIILHEATHNFGPFSDYRVKGKPAKEVFGGQLSSTLEELKAQAGGMWYLQLLKKKGLITEEQLKEAYTRSITWAFGHISQGMFSSTGNVKPYSQLSAILIGSFMEDGSLTFKNSKFAIHYQKLPSSIEKIVKQVGYIKATGDIDGGRKWIDYYVKGKGHSLVHQAHITTELQRYPKANFMYSVNY